MHMFRVHLPVDILYMFPTEAWQNLLFFENQNPKYYLYGTNVSIRHRFIIQEGWSKRYRVVSSFWCIKKGGGIVQQMGYKTVNFVTSSNISWGQYIFQHVSKSTTRKWKYCFDVNAHFSYYLGSWYIYTHFNMAFSWSVHIEMLSWFNGEWFQAILSEPEFIRSWNSDCIARWLTKRFILDSLGLTRISP